MPWIGFQPGLLAGAFLWVRILGAAICLGDPGRADPGARLIVQPDRIELRGFGSFRTRQRRGRTGRNPKTGATVAVPAKRVPFFKAGKELKELLNQPQQ